MDISELLATMQTNPGDRALARGTHMSMGIPDDTDAKPDDQSQTQQQMVADDDQSFADGGAVDRLGDDNLSENIEDRRGEVPSGAQNNGSTYDFALAGQRDKMLASDNDKWAKTKEKLAGGRWFAEGGEVPDEGAIPEEGVAPPPAEEPAPQGAIPEPEGEAPPAPAPRGMQARREAVNEQQPQDGGSDWKTAAMEGINKAVDWGYNTIHGVNRAVGGEDDPEHKGAVQSMMNGHGAISSEQYKDLLQAVDPSGLMDPATRQLKAIGTLFQHYGQESIEKGAAAVWGALQKTRTYYDKARAIATVAAEKDKPDAAAAAAQHALNLVPDGLFSKVTALTKRALAGRPLVDDGRPEPTDADLPEWGKRALAGGPAMGNMSPGAAPAAPAGIPETPPAAPGATTPVAPENRIGMGDQASEMNPSMHMQGPQEPPAFKVVQSDPESGQVVAQHVLTREQMIDMLAQPFDKSLHQGTVTHAGNSSQTPPGQGQHMMTWGQKLAVANGLPSTMDISGMDTAAIGRLRDQYRQHQMHEEGPNARHASDLASKEKIAGGVQEGSTARTKITNEGSERREHIRAGNDPSTGQPRPDSNLTGKGAARDSNMETQAQKAAKNAFDNKPATDKRTYDDFLDAARKKYNVAAVRPGATPAAAPQAPAGQAPKPQYVNGQTVLGKDGKQYRFNAETQHMDPI